MTCCCFGFCGTQRAFQSVHFGFLSLILQLASSAKSFSHRLSENMLGLKEKSWIIFRKSRIICGQTCNIHVILNAHFVPYFGGRILEFFRSLFFTLIAFLYWVSPLPLVTIIATLGVLWASRRVASPSIEIPIHFFWKKKFADKLHKSYKKTSVANFTYLFWTLYFASRTKNKLKQLYFNGAVSMFFQQSLHLPKNKQPKWRLLWSHDPWDLISWFPLPSLGPSPMENPMLKG